MANRQNEKDSSNENRYNGWTNYETWPLLSGSTTRKVHRLLASGSQAATRNSIHSEQVSDGIWTSNEAARLNLADQLKEEITDAASRPWSFSLFRPFARGDGFGQLARNRRQPD